MSERYTFFNALELHFSHLDPRLGLKMYIFLTLEFTLPWSHSMVILLYCMNNNNTNICDDKMKFLSIQKRSVNKLRSLDYYSLDPRHG